jgi:hypothetical protein
MATQGTYYLDAPSLSSATVIYSDVDLTTVAADGFYSDGTIVREQVSGVLLPQNSCPSCATPCGGTISASGEQGIYYLDTDLGTDTGAVVITFDPYSVPDGILATFNSLSYNGLSSPTYGWLQGSAGLPTYIGSSSNDCDIVANSPHTLSEFQYDGSTFASLGTTTSVTVLSGQMQLTAGGPGSCVMVIPKTSASPSILNLQFIGPCEGTAFAIGVACPTALTEFESTSMFESTELACDASIDQSYYVAHVNGAAGVLGLYDLVFSDLNGEFKLSAGYYKTADAGDNDWFQVDANGVIIAFGTCGSTEIEVTNAYGYMEPCSGGTVDDYMGAYVSLSSPAVVDTDFQVEVQYTSIGGSCVGASTQTFTITILEGETTSNFVACSSGLYVPGGADICNACISFCSDSTINLSTFGC